MALSLIAFDLDDTLAPSKSPLPPLMNKRLCELLDHYEVCVISGGQMKQFRSQLLKYLSAEPQELEHLHLMPTCGTRYLRYRDGHWIQQYANDLSRDDRERAMESLDQRAHELGLWEANPFGDIIEDRGSQITFSALGQEAPLEAKRAWDPTGEKKMRLREAVAKDLPHLEVRSGGSTSVDITLRGIDKAFGMHALVKETGIAMEDMLFIGDRLDEQGNDYPVKAAGFDTRAVSGWEECAEVIEELIGVARRL